MLLHEKLQGKQLILGSQSPRRQDYLRELNLSFEIQSPNSDESFPDTLKGAAITDHIALEKAKAIILDNTLQIAITCDTIVWHENQALGKPKDHQEAFNMLKSLSGKTHEVISSVCLKSLEKTVVFHAVTAVTFTTLDDITIDYYITNYKPFDKAGSYGIQEWIGLVGIEEIKGSYSNVVGLPTEKLVKELHAFL